MHEAVAKNEKTTPRCRGNVKALVGEPGATEFGVCGGGSGGPFATTMKKRQGHKLRAYIHIDDSLMIN